MKKILISCLIAICFVLTGCGKYDSKDVVKDFSKKVENLKAYYLEGEMQVINNEDVYKYDVKVSYQEKDFFRISLKNKSNNHEQIILKNEEGVYVLTPSLNKSFKFQSEWPYNNSQVYLLQSILKDIKDDSEKTYEETDNYYVFTTKVNYPNNRRLVKQVIYLDKKLNLKEVHVLNENNNPEIKMTIKSIDTKPTFDKKHFNLTENMKVAVVDEVVTPVMKIEDVIFPMFIPENTHLTSQDVISKSVGERVILTFEGDKPFILIEETVAKEEEFTIIPTFGEPELLIDTVGYITDSSLSWSSNGMEYYIASENLTRDELLEVARSINAIPVMK